METKHRKGDFLVYSAICNETGRSIVAMTGTKEKVESLRSIVQPENSYIPGILGLIAYELAGNAKEPVTHNGDFLIVGKAQAQEKIFLSDAKNNPDLNKLNGTTCFLLRLFIFFSLDNQQ